ncbi:hypothetical protein [Streptomyces sp. NBC_00878]|uniref:hypothetical protein n=1 Tax=Streptomyces sp. NBC_00878 TaxID=2975854 RepID=UPI00225A1D8D|nr:hypothetical protein [Streptomyces sp. NBC_00878]MCX4911899.1 hypothetical protein [Streptomyces sp. NBC_00878]
MHTASRRSGPRKWLRAVAWLIAAGLHPRANATTRTIAEDLAARMDYDTGHARYLLDDTVARTGISKASVKRHVGYLRELGALAWVQHGTRSNVRRLMGLKGYAATATVYAAVIPPAYDHAMGHTIVGSGYTARIIIDQRGQPSPVDNPPVDNSGSQGLEPPSLNSVEEEGKLKVEGGFNYTSRERASRDRGSIPHQKSTNSSGRHALQVAKDILIARQVRPLVNWTQREGLRRLAFALRPLIDLGLDSYAIADRLHGMCSGMRWQPKAPAAYISTVLADQDQRTATQQAAAAKYEMENCPVGAFQGALSTRLNVMAGVQEGLARYRKNCRDRGLDDLSDSNDTTWDAQADILAFLNGSPA